jgi:ADP-ribosyl-[dinitrogen reductase] hydrolase
VNSIKLKSRFSGSILGLAVGDAFGTSVEFKPRGTFEPVTDMVGGGVFSLNPGQWTDDTSMALCLAESLLEFEGMNLTNQLEKYTLWYEDGYLSSTGTCFDIGNTVRLALNAFKRTNNPYSGPSDKYSAGNGSIMRLAPVALLYSYNLNDCLKMSAESSKTTHQAQESVEACELLASLIYGALKDLSKEELLSTDLMQKIGTHWSPGISHIASGSYKEKHINEIKSSGYVVHTLEAALWAFYHTSSFTEGLMKVVNLGDDADTTGAVYGQLAGAFYGVDGIPKKWIDQLAFRNKIENDANRLYELHQHLANQTN